MVGAEGGRGQKRVGQAEGREGTDKVRGVDGDERVVEKRIKGEEKGEGTGGGGEEWHEGERRWKWRKEREEGRENMDMKNCEGSACVY